MGLPRSTYYDTLATEADTEIVARITAIAKSLRLTAIDVSGPSYAIRGSSSTVRRSAV